MSSGPNSLPRPQAKVRPSLYLYPSGVIEFSLAAHSSPVETNIGLSYLSITDSYPGHSSE